MWQNSALKKEKGKLSFWNMVILWDKKYTQMEWISSIHIYKVCISIYNYVQNIWTYFRKLKIKSSQKIIEEEWSALKTEWEQEKQDGTLKCTKHANKTVTLPLIAISCNSKEHRETCRLCHPNFEMPRVFSRSSVWMHTPATPWIRDMMRLYQDMFPS